MRRILSVLSKALGRPIGHGCWVDPTMGGSANTLGRVEAECPPEHHDPARPGTTLLGKDVVSAPRPSGARDRRMPTGVIVGPSARETFTPREITDAYKKFTKHGPRYLDAESGIEGSVYRFGTRVLVVYEEPETGLVVLYSPNVVEGLFSEARINGVLRSSHSQARADNTYGAYHGPS